MPSDSEKLIDLDLTDKERKFLFHGLNEWRGPAHLTEVVAKAIGFETVDDFLQTTLDLRDSIESGKPLSNLDWTRVLQSTEIVFISPSLGAAWDWDIVTEFTDAESFVLLRSIQLKLFKTRRALFE